MTVYFRDVIHYFWITGALLSVIIFLNTTHVLISKNSDFCEAEEDVDDFLMRNDLLHGLPKSTLGLKGENMTNSAAPIPSSGNIESVENTDIGSSGDKTVSDPGVTVEEVTVPKEWVPEEKQLSTPKSNSKEVSTRRTISTTSTSTTVTSLCEINC